MKLMASSTERLFATMASVCPVTLVLLPLLAQVPLLT